MKIKESEEYKSVRWVSAYNNKYFHFMKNCVLIISKEEKNHLMYGFSCILIHPCRDITSL
jgi:hypothetical protein